MLQDGAKIAPEHSGNVRHGHGVTAGRAAEDSVPCWGRVWILSEDILSKLCGPEAAGFVDLVQRFAEEGWQAPRSNALLVMESRR